MRKDILSLTDFFQKDSDLNDSYTCIEFLPTDSLALPGLISSGRSIVLVDKGSKEQVSQSLDLGDGIYEVDTIANLKKANCDVLFLHGDTKKWFWFYENYEYAKYIVVPKKYTLSLAKGGG